MIKNLLRGFLKRFRYLPPALFAFWCLGQFFRDLYWASGLCFYIPSVLVCLLLVAAAWFERSEGRKKYARGLLLTAVYPLVMILFIENHFYQLNVATQTSATEAPGGPVFKLLHWNVCKGRTGMARVLDYLKEFDADLVALSELPHGTDLNEVSSSLGEGYQFVRQFDLALFVRGKVELTSDQIVQEEPPLVSKRLKIMGACCDLENGVQLNLWMADLVSYLEVPRNPSLQVLNQKLQEFQPDIVVGDFNAPRRSLGLSDLPEGFQHAYDLQGSGWGYTFPVPVPVYAIDQCLVNDTVTLRRYELDSTLLSDHRLQIIEFSL